VPAEGSSADIVLGPSANSYSGRASFSRNAIINLLVSVSFGVILLHLKARSRNGVKILWDSSTVESIRSKLFVVTSISAVGRIRCGNHNRLVKVIDRIHEMKTVMGFFEDW
jgi:hypothetical protein